MNMIYLFLFNQIYEIYSNYSTWGSFSFTKANCLVKTPHFNSAKLQSCGDLPKTYTLSTSINKNCKKRFLFVANCLS